MSVATYGQEFVPGISDVTGITAAGVSASLASIYQWIIQMMKSAQQTQEQLTEAQGNAVETTLDKSSKATFYNGISSLTSGAVNFTGSAVSAIGRGLRSTPDAGISGVNEAQDALTGGKAQILSGSADDLGQKDGLQGNVGDAGDKGPVGPKAAVGNKLAYLAHQDYTKMGNDKNKILGDLSKLKNFKDADGSDGKLYNDALKQIKSSKKIAQNTQETYNQKTELWDKKFNDLSSATAQATGAIGTFKSSEAQTDQAKASKQEQFAKFASDSIGSDIQAQNKAADQESEAQRQVDQNLISGVGRANHFQG